MWLSKESLLDVHAGGESHRFAYAKLCYINSNNNELNAASFSFSVDLSSLCSTPVR